jgi:uncharacterized membrane protein
MYKDVLNHANMVHWAEMGLVIFVAVFLLTTIWAVTRSKRQIEEWSALPLSAANPRPTDDANGASHD